MLPLQSISESVVRFQLKAEFAGVYPELEPGIVYSGQCVAGRRDFIRVILAWPHGTVRQLAVRHAHVAVLGAVTPPLDSGAGYNRG